MTKSSLSARVRTRFAPSPTGSMHLGSLRTALFTWLWARHNDGDFVLRIEDTDSKRFDPASISSITKGLEWLGLDWDEGPSKGGNYGPYTQSKRGAIYRRVAGELIDSGKAYRCFCTPARLQQLREMQEASNLPRKYDRACRQLGQEQVEAKLKAGVSFAVRLAMPTDGKITFPDLIRGEIEVDASSLQDPIVLKSDGMALYHLAVVVDDHFMKITHVLRGQEWLATAPYHFMLYRALGWDPPVMVHLPVILNPNGKGKMSKRHLRSNGQFFPVHVHEFAQAGYLPDAMFNFLALLGWTPEAEQEIFHRHELIERFDIARIAPSAAAMPYDKLNWMNGEYLRSLSHDSFQEMVIPILVRAFSRRQEEIESMTGLRYVLPDVQSRIKTLEECPSWLDWLFRRTEEMEYTDLALLMGRGLDAAQSAFVLQKCTQLLQVTEPFLPERLHEAFRNAASELEIKAGSFFGPVRGALSGSRVSPPLFSMMAALGREESLARIIKARNRLKEQHGKGSLT